MCWQKVGFGHNACRLQTNVNRGHFRRSPALRSSDSALRSCRDVSECGFVSARATDLLPFIARSFGLVTGAPAASAKVEDGFGVNDGEGTMSNLLGPDDSTGAKVLKVGAVMWV